MGALHGLNPYADLPISAPHSDPAYHLSNWHHLLSPYGPLFTLVTYALAPLGVPAGFWTWKVLLSLASLGTLAVVWRCAGLLGRDPRLAVAVVGLNPLVLVWGLGGDHNDALMVLALTGALLAMLTRREAAGGAALAAAVGIKASALVAVPVLLAGSPRKLRALAGFAAAGVVLAVASYAAFGAHVPDVGTQSKLVAAVSVPNLVGLALGAGGETAALRTVVAAALASLLALSWVMPWYVLLLLPFAALSRSRVLLGAALVLGVWLILSWMPLMPDLVHGLGFYPSRTPLGHEHNVLIRGLLH
jgi:type IV secretory pathway TrbD component